MTSKEAQSLLPSLVMGELAPAVRQQVEQVLEADDALRKEAKELHYVYGQLRKPEAEEPGPALDKWFYQHLSEQTPPPVSRQLGRERWSFPWVVAASVSLLILVGVVLGRLSVRDKETKIMALEQQVQATNKLLMMTLLQQESPTERLQAVAYSHTLPAQDKAVVHLLLATLREDPNVNVRLAAVEALARFEKVPLVRAALVEALSRSQESALQLAIMNQLASWQEKRALPVLEQLLEHSQTPTYVRKKAQKTIQVISL